MDIHDTLYTKRLRIVPLDQEHFVARKAAAAAAAAHDEQAQNLYDAMQELQERAKADDAAHFWWYTNREIYLRETNEYLGSIALMSAPDTDPEHLVEVGYSLLPDARGNGYMREALGAICDLVFTIGGAQMAGMIAGVEISNVPSQHVLAACGFVKTDEVLRWVCKFGNAWHPNIPDLHQKKEIFQIRSAETTSYQNCAVHGAVGEEKSNSSG